MAADNEPEMKEATLRDLMAAHALTGQGLMTFDHQGWGDEEKRRYCAAVAHTAYAYADAMMEERKR